MAILKTYWTPYNVEVENGINYEEYMITISIVGETINQYVGCDYF